MKRLVLLFIIPVLTSCGKSSEANPTEIDSAALVKEVLLGTWQIDSVYQKSYTKCTYTCTILNPDGSIKDTVRKKYLNLDGSYWKFTLDSMISIDKSIGQPYQMSLKYWIVGNYNRIQPYGLNPYLILRLNSHSLIVDGFNTSVTVNDKYDEIYRRHFLSR